MSSTQSMPFPAKHRQARVFRSPAVQGNEFPQNGTTSGSALDLDRLDDRYSPGTEVDWLDLTDSKATLPVHLTLDQVQQYFRDHPEEKYAAALENDRIVGLCSELSITRKLTVSRGLGYHVYAKTNLDRHLEPSCLVIQRGDPVREVLYKVMSRKEGFFDDIILTDREGHFLGLIRTQSMMLLQHRISQLQVADLEDLTLQLNDNNVELERARDVAMQAAEMKSSFLANMSHEIRTPLNGILGMVKILMRTELAAQQRRYATTVLNSANALLTILNDILDFSKIEAGKMTFEQIPFDLSDLIEESVQLLSERAREKKIEIFSWTGPNVSTRIISDSTRLRQVILNLASNAVKFTEKGEVVVRIESLGETETHATLKISIKDTGIGLTPETRDRLFRPFEQGDRSTSRKFGGTGLGLAISKKIVEMLGGTIGCESEPGLGSTFWFTIDFAKQTTPPLSDRREEELWGLRILIVGESPTFGSYLEQHMSKWKVVSRVVRQAPEALELARSQADRGTIFDIVIADYNLQSLNGVELARHFHEDPRLARCRFILLTSFENELAADSLRSIGVAAVMTKPLKPSELYDTLAASIRERTDRESHPPVAVVAAPPALIPLPVTVAVAPAPTPNLSPTPGQTEAPIRLAASAQERSCPPLHLLLVEDSEVNREVALILLESWGHTLETAENGRVAVDKLKTHRYDGILMDCQMPEMDGYEATRIIRQHGSGVLQPDIPIVAMTANAMPGDRENCLRAGMNDYVGKPIEEADLLRALLHVAELKNRAPAPVPSTAKPSSPAPAPNLAPASASEPVASRQPVPRYFAEEPEPLPHTLPIESPSPSAAPEPEPLSSAQFAPSPVFHTAPVVSEPTPAPTEDPEDEPYFPARLIHLFLKETEARLGELRESVQRGDIEIVQRISHTIKGTAGNFRANRLYEVTREIEKVSREIPAQDLAPLVVQAEEAFESIKVKYLNSASKTPPN
jgi:signal transduction histidine kinase/CheY-like chemotaxis protein/HPt (histidine-containing phosphotransfer) domain-containing protein